MLLLSERNERQENEARRVKATAVFLFQVASIIASKRFHWLMKNTESRFEWATVKTHERLIQDLLRQAFDIVPDEHIKGGISAYMELLGEKIHRIAEAIAFQEGLEIPRKHQKFTMPSSAKWTASQIRCYLETLKQTQNESIDLERVGRQYPIFDFPTRKLIGALRTYLQSRLTLVEALPQPKVEAFLASLDEDFVLKGYPHDMLAYDAESIRSGRSGVAIIVRHEYMSCWWVDNTCLDLLGHKGFITLPLE